MKNKYEIRGETTAIFINSPKYGATETLISTSKLKKCKEFKNSWYLRQDSRSKSFYAFGTLPRKNGKHIKIALHRWLNDDPEGMIIDHIDHNGLNNTDENLRVVTHAENNQNKKGAMSNSKTRIRGVSWDKISNSYKGKVTVKGRQIHVGFFDSLEEADIAVREVRFRNMPFSH